MKHALLVIFLAGCPDPADTPAPPQPYDPHDACVGFGMSFTTQTYADAYYFGPTRWGGETGSDVKPIAVGGIEYVSIYGAPYIDLTTPEFTATVTGPALAIDPTPTAITTAAVVGAASGTADLCIYDHGSTELHDGVRLSARPVTSMLAVPASPYYQPWERSLTGGTYPFDHWFMFTGARRTVGVALLGEHDWRLVDQGMAIDTAFEDGSFTAATRETWDSVSRDIDHAGTLHVRATLRSGEVWTSQVAFTDHVDAIALLPPTVFPPLDHLTINGGWFNLCFDATVDGTRVIGAPYVFTASSQVVIHPQPNPANCVYMEPVENGEGSVVATIGETSLAIPFHVDP